MNAAKRVFEMGCSLCSSGFGVGDPQPYSGEGKQAGGGSDLPRLSDSHPRNIRDPRSVCPLRKSNHVEQLSNWFRVEGLVTLVYFARMGHNFYPAEVVVGEIAAISPAIDNHHQPGWQTERRNPPNRDAQRGIAAVEITGNDTRVAAVKRK